MNANLKQYTNPPKEYYNIIPLLCKDATYNVMQSTRSKGKSFQVKLKALWEAYHEMDYLDFVENGTETKITRYQFGYMRRYGDDLKAKAVERYFDDMPIEIITDGEYTQVTCYRGELYFSNVDEKDVVKRGKNIGVVFSVNGAEHYKSRMYPCVGNLIFEEAMTTSGYLSTEIDDFFSIVSTVARNDNIKVFLIGNMVDRLCPYYFEWELTHATSMEPGQIDLYNQQNGEDENGNPTYIRIAVEMCATNGKAKSNMFWGRKAKNITGNEWETADYPKIPRDYRSGTVYYKVLLKYQTFKFLINLMIDKDKNPFLFVYPYTGNESKITRKITDEFTMDRFTTQRLTSVTKYDNLVIELIEQSKCCFSDNLTGSDFYRIVKERM